MTPPELSHAIMGRSKSGKPRVCGKRLSWLYESCQLAAPYLFSWREDMENEFLGTWAEHRHDDVTSDINDRCKELGVFDICLMCERDCKMVKCKGVQVHCCGSRRRP